MAEPEVVRALKADLRTDRSADFLIASLCPSRLVAVKDGKMRNLPADWIGDPTAFTEYQRFYHQAVIEPLDGFYDSAD